MATRSSILVWRIPWTGAWWATVHSVAKESDRTEAAWHTGKSNRFTNLLAYFIIIKSVR